MGNLNLGGYLGVMYQLGVEQSRIGGLIWVG